MLKHLSFYSLPFFGWETLVNRLNGWQLVGLNYQSLCFGQPFLKLGKAVNVPHNDGPCVSHPPLNDGLPEPQATHSQVGARTQSEIEGVTF